MTEKQYIEATGINFSTLKVMVKETPLHYWNAINNPTAPTASMDFGSAFHSSILEPNLFESNYIQKPEGMNFSTKEGKEWKLANGNKKIISCDDYKTIFAMKKSVYGNEILKKALENGTKEKSIFWKHTQTGLQCKARPDLIFENTCFDFKTTDDASRKGFEKSIGNYSYHIQAAWYLKALSDLGVTNFVFACVEKNAPHGLAMYKLDEHTIDHANIQINVAMETINHCLKNDFWPGYTTEISTISAPVWA